MKSEEGRELLCPPWSKRSGWGCWVTRDTRNQARVALFPLHPLRNQRQRRVLNLTTLQCQEAWLKRLSKRLCSRSKRSRPARLRGPRAPQSSVQQERVTAPVPCTVQQLPSQWEVQAHGFLGPSVRQREGERIQAEGTALGQDQGHSKSSRLAWGGQMVKRVILNSLERIFWRETWLVWFPSSL